MTTKELKPVKRDIEDEHGVTYYTYGQAEGVSELSLPKHLELEQLEDWYAGWCSVNGKPYFVGVRGVLS